MRIVHFEKHGVPGIAAEEGSGWHGLTQRESGFPGTLPELIAQGADLLRIGRSLGQSSAIDLNAVRLRRLCPYRRKFSASVLTTMITWTKAG
jgi:acylpyruvate hydrolase